jgi:Uma2 family endonuclease
VDDPVLTSSSSIIPVRQSDSAPRTVSAEEYDARYAHDFYEWSNGELIKMSPVTDMHDETGAYLRDLFRAYFALRPLGTVRAAPFLQRIDAIQSRREPDLQIILNDNPGQLTPTAMIGPADICIEIVSLESVSRDYGDKFTEYEKGGVKEYWMFDHLRRVANFHRLNSEGIYVLIAPDAEGFYETPLLPGLKLHVSTLWRMPLPDILAIVEAVRKMVEDSAE